MQVLLWQLPPTPRCPRAGCSPGRRAWPGVHRALERSAFCRTCDHPAPTGRLVLWLGSCGGWWLSAPAPWSLGLGWLCL